MYGLLWFIGFTVRIGLVGVISLVRGVYCRVEREGVWACRVYAVYGACSG